MADTTYNKIQFLIDSLGTDTIIIQNKILYAGQSVQGNSFYEYLKDIIIPSLSTTPYFSCLLKNY